jgi:uncharacterized protein (DUF2225 family)
MNRRNFLTLAAAGFLGAPALLTAAARGKVLTANRFSNLSLTTWSPKDFDCPVCKTKNTFQIWMSYGDYIYSWPSKYQWVFWPWTDSPSVYLCKQCHVATFLDDYEKLPKDKIPVLQKELAKIPFNRKFKDYLEVPMSERLEIAEKVYPLLNRKEDEFWNFFYRIKGYHYGQEEQPQKAAEARKKALELTQKMIKDPANKTPMKELLYISGAMKHFLNDDKGAAEDFRKGLATKFASTEVKPEEIKGAEEGMNERFNDYIKQIGSKKPPRLTQNQDVD